MAQRPSRVVAFIASELNRPFEEIREIVLDHKERAQLSTRDAVRDVLAWVRMYKEMEAVVSAN